jgi:phosphoribosylaminoimidazolecarboxamide formyltransferase / IMP cyclohydrolase
MGSGAFFVAQGGFWMRAIISVSDKRGVVEFGRGLQELGWSLYSTGGTLAALTEGGVGAASISKITNYPEILGGRVKTLHPAVHGGILHRRDNDADLAEIAAHGIEPVDLVVVNLYPFRETIQRPDVVMSEALEQIDIGGPTMLRASAKNFPAVLVVVDPDDYERVLEALRAGDVPYEQRQALAAKAFGHTASYDSAIAAYLTAEPFPATLPTSWHKLQELRSLRREPAPTRGVLPPGWCHRGDHRVGAPASRQGTLLYQHPGRRCCLTDRARVRHAHRHDPQAHQPVWACQRR